MAGRCAVTLRGATSGLAGTRYALQGVAARGVAEIGTATRSEADRGNAELGNATLGKAQTGRASDLPRGAASAAPLTRWGSA